VTVVIDPAVITAITATIILSARLLTRSPLFPLFIYSRLTARPARFTPRFARSDKVRRVIKSIAGIPIKQASGEIARSTYLASSNERAFDAEINPAAFLSRPTNPASNPAVTMGISFTFMDDTRFQQRPPRSRRSRNRAAANARARARARVRCRSLKIESICASGLEIQIRREISADGRPDFPAMIDTSIERRSYGGRRGGAPPPPVVHPRCRSIGSI